MLSFRIIALAAPALWLAGCASLPDDWGRDAAAQRVSARGLSLPDDTASRARSAQWLAEPLTLDRAIQIALIHNPELRARYARLGFSAADVYEAGRLPNPLLSMTRLSAGSEPQSQLTIGLAFDFTDALFMRARSRAARGELDAEQSAIAGATLDLAAEVEAAYRRAAAAAQIAELQQTLAGAAATSAELAQRYYDAGNLKPRDLALEQASRAEAALQADSARLDAELARRELQRLLGVHEEIAALAEPLATPSGSEPALETLLQLAQDSRLDVVAARTRAEAIAARHGLTRRARWLPGVQLGAEREREYDGSVHAGPSLGLSLPLFDSGAGRVARAQAALDTAESELDARELDLRRDVTRAYARVINSRTRAERYRDELIPAREEAVAQMQREQNFMLIGVFELLAARQQAFVAYHGYLQALRDYAVARAELAHAVGRRLPANAEVPPAPAAHEHEHEHKTSEPAAAQDGPPHDPHHHHGAE